MIWIIIIIGIVGYLVYITLADRNKILKEQVDSHGGMAAKYDFLIKALMAWPDSKVTKVTRERIEITSSGEGLTSEFYSINEGYNCVDIEYCLTNQNRVEKSRKWKFDRKESQESMLKSIALDFMIMRR